LLHRTTQTMGIQGLAQLLEEHAPDCVEEVDISSLFGQKIALDANQAVMAAVEDEKEGAEPLSSASHAQRVFQYTAKFLKEGIKPVFVFDGEIKSNPGSSNQQATAETLEYCKLLLDLMGVPVVNAPCEASAQAAALVKVGLVNAASSGSSISNGSMDSLLAFQAPVVLQNLNPTTTTTAVKKVHFQTAMQLLDLSPDQFVDLCILLGCDYCETIPGMDANIALQWIRDYICMESIVEVVQEENSNARNGKKYAIPPSWLPPKDAILEGDEDEEEAEETAEVEVTADFVPAYVRARKKFQDHNVLTKNVRLKWKSCQGMELKLFLTEQIGLSAEEVESEVSELESVYEQALMEDMNQSFEMKPMRPPSRTNSNNTGSLNGGSLNGDEKGLSLSGHTGHSGNSGNLDWIGHHRASNNAQSAGDLGASMASFISDGYFDDDEDFEVTEEMRRQWEADIEE